MSRGDRREAIFKDDPDRVLFLETLGQACQKTDWQVHAWCLMGNHFHLVVETPKANLVAGMKWFLGTYTGRFNRRHKVLGQMAEKAGASHYGEELQESAEEKAQRIVAEEMRKLGWAQADLEQHRKGDRRKVRIARRLRQETTMTLKWIAERLRMGTWTHVTNRLYHLKK